MKHLKKISEGFIHGPGGHLNDKSSTSDRINYRINELKWISDMFDSKRDNIDEDMLSEISEHINKLHDIINRL